jgi:hypothetical protein
MNGSARYILIRETVGTANARPIVAHGTCAEDDVTIQGGGDDVAVAADAFWFDLPTTYSGDEFDLHYYDPAAEALVLRPSLAEPVGGAAPLVVPVGGCPAGTAMRVTNEAGDVLNMTTADGDLTLVDAGAYHLRVLPPFPWLPVAVTLEVM